MHDLVEKVIAPVEIGGTVQIKMKDAVDLLAHFEYKPPKTVGDTFLFMGRNCVVI